MQENGHELEILAKSRHCTVYRCDCGLYHVQLKNVAMKLSEEQFREARDCMLLAGSAMGASSPN